MKAEDMQLGDCYLHRGKICRVEYITRKKIGYFTEDRHGYQHDIPNRFQPIPISEEALARNGFELVDDHWKCRGANSVIEVYKVGSAWRIDVYGNDNGRFVKRNMQELLHVLRACCINKKVEFRTLD